ncbi:unnamed protein product [Bursaphelenchus okinawaensis]|uniref:Uncharacterized protein n=1 Tax=Bursaphelenchus okinawaensis TaxID=465554 RepID=A0A811JRT3_9BILA|nr:unnamed protein product [Bursaphelenchus okinawaensis]CAG9080657.1 unnamed protein product [Bursaphelenchus okinawaensis]
MDTKLEKLLKQNLGNNGELKVQKDLVDALVEFVRENCCNELETLSQRINLRSKSISTSGVASWSLYNHSTNDDTVLIHRKIKSLCDVAVMEPEFKRIKSRILRVCHKVASTQNRRSASETRTTYSSTAGSSDTILATSVLSFGQSIKSIDGRELDHLVGVLHSDVDVKAKKSAINSLMTMSSFGMVRSRALAGLFNALNVLIPQQELFEVSMELLLKLLASNDFRPWTFVMENICGIYEVVDDRFDSTSVEYYQFADFCYQLLSQSSSFYRSFPLDSRQKVIPNLFKLLLISSKFSSANLLSVYSILDIDATFMKIRLLSFSDRQVFLNSMPELIDTFSTFVNLNIRQKCFLFCFYNRLICYHDLVQRLDMDKMVDSVRLLLVELFCDKKVNKDIRKTAGKVLLQASNSESGASFYYTNLLIELLSIRTYLALQALLNIVKLTELSLDLDSENQQVLVNFIRRCLQRRQTTVFTLIMEAILMLYRRKPEFGVSLMVEVDSDERLDPKHTVHSKILLLSGRSQRLWRHYSHVFLVSNSLHLICHQIEFSLIEDRRFVAKTLVNFLSPDSSTPIQLKEYGSLILIILLDCNFVVDILRSMDFGFLIDERFKALYSKQNYSFLYNLALLLYNPEILVEVRRQFSVWNRVLQYVQTIHNQGVKCDESTDIKSEGINVIFPKFDFTELQKPLWEIFMDSEAKKEWSLKELLRNYIKHHDAKRDVGNEPSTVPDWIHPFLDYGVGLGKERSRRRLISRLQSFSFLSDRPDYFVVVLLLTTDFDVDLCSQLLTRIPESQMFWPRSFSSNSLFYEKFSQITYRFINCALGDHEYINIGLVVDELKVPLFHLISNWIERFFIGMLSVEQLEQLIGYQLVLGHNFTGYLCVVILKYIMERLSLNDKKIEDFMFPDLSEFDLRDYLIDFKKLDRIRIHSQQ